MVFLDVYFDNRSHSICNVVQRKAVHREEVIFKIKQYDLIHHASQFSGCQVSEWSGRRSSGRESYIEGVVE